MLPARGKAQGRLRDLLLNEGAIYLFDALDYGRLDRLPASRPAARRRYPMNNPGRTPTQFTVTEQAGVRFLEGPPDLPLLDGIDDAGLVVEACFSNRVSSALLYAPNLTARFFDLSSGEAGAILQKLRNYRIRVAVVCIPGAVRFSSRFREMADEESAGGQFRVFESVPPARQWLSATR